MDLLVRSEAHPNTSEPKPQTEYTGSGSQSQGRERTMAAITRIQSHPHYRIDNILIDEYGEKIGALGIAIYNVLARYADG